MLGFNHLLRRGPCGENEVLQRVEMRRLLPRDPLQLHSVEEWLRGFREQQLPNMANVVYCRKCGIHIYAFPDPVPITHHHVCGSVVTRLDDHVWRRLSNRIKQHYRKDRLLFARLNAERSLFSKIPDLNGPLAWVTTEWHKAAMSPGRPRDLEQQRCLAFWLHALSRPRPVMEQGEHPSELWVHDDAGNPRRLIPQGPSKKWLEPPRWGVLPPIMTLSGAIEVLTGGDLKQAISRRVPWRQRQLFGELSIKELMQIRSAFRKQWQKQFGGVPTVLSRREAERILVLHKNMQSGGKVRIKGLSLREKPSRKTEQARGPHAQLLSSRESKLAKRGS